MELSDSKIKKCFIFPQKKTNFSCISGNGTQHFLSPSLKDKKMYPEKISYTPENSLYFLEIKVFYFLGNGNPERNLFLYFRKRKPLKHLIFH